MPGLFTSNSKLSKGYNNFTVEQVWRSVFGEVISKYTTKVHFLKGVLTVYISSSALKQELTLTREKVVTKLNENLKYNRVEKLIIK